MKETLKIFGVLFDLSVFPVHEARQKLGCSLGGTEKFDQLFEPQAHGFFGIARCTLPAARKERFLVRAWGETASKVFEMLASTTEREMGVKCF